MLLIFYTLITYITFQCLSELSKLVKIAALWKTNALLHHLRNSFSSHWLKLLQSVWIHFAYIKAQLAHMICYTIRSYGSYLNKNGGVDWSWLHHWFKLDINYQLIHGSIYNPSKHLTHAIFVANVNTSALPWVVIKLLNPLICPHKVQWIYLFYFTWTSQKF